MATNDIERAFPHDNELRIRVTNAYIRCQNDPELSQVFIDIAHYIERTQPSTSKVIVQQPPSKKRKVETNGSSHDLSESATFFECKDVSFTIPARKKLKLELVSSTSDGQVKLVDSKTGTTEFALDASGIEQAFCLPVPDKAQRQQNYVIIPKETSQEQILFTMNEAIDKTGSIGVRSTATQEEKTFTSVTTQELAAFLSKQGKKLTRPNDKEFASSIPQSHRKGEKAYHVKAFRGSKDGYLFFLPNGIFFGFKKPLLFFSFAAVESISYTSVLQRTFNLVITPHSDDDSAQDVEFSMLDQADFAGIDEYIKAHGLNDASMAADRRAKMYNVNKQPKTEEADGEAADDGQTELEKAEQQLQDEEDELEEDYDPSGGDSDGEGEESEEESDDGDVNDAEDDEDDEES
ncbi:hypothetical protein AMS68_002873 [Peltaster fructicola]|uniref:Histone chaperone RTT106/FACT complex subunit SPT16-like middle domain-containing protein n=1 Tax=Peltaster fructicola TaxID=286661 RepID=A0A6H0XRP2_9PEZI|nr:hypothetical protein AMS68_002873 [Peltaster fructicola]